MSVFLSWINPNTPPNVETSVNVYRSTSPMVVGSLPTPLATLSAGVLEYTDTTATDGVSYYYRVGYMKGAVEYVSGEINVLAPTGGATVPFTLWVNGDTPYGAIVNPQGNSVLGKSPYYVLGDWYSIRKLLVALAVVRYKESVLSSETVTITSADTSATSGEWLSGFVDGDIITLYDLICLMLVPSKSDVTATIERTFGQWLFETYNLGGNAKEAIAIAMFREATEARVRRGTTFAASVTISGEWENQQILYSCDDICKIAMAAANNEIILDIMQLETLSITCTGPAPKTLAFTSIDRNQRFTNMNGTPTGFKIPGYLCGKTGDAGATGHQVFVWENAAGNVVGGVVRDISSRGRRQAAVMGAMVEAEARFPSFRGSEVAADPYAASRVLNIKGDAITDVSPSARSLTNTGVTLAASPFMHLSALSIASGNYLEVTSPFDLESGDFTIEAFLTGVSGYDATCDILTHYKVATGGRGFEFGLDSGSLYMYVSSNGTNNSSASCTIGSSYVLASGAPMHVVAQRSSNQIRTFVNGIPGDALTWASPVYFPASTKMLVGGRMSSSDVFERKLSAKIDELIVTKGVARYNNAGFLPKYRPSRWG